MIFSLPKKNRNILPQKSEYLLKVDLSGNSISEIVAPKEAGGNCPVVKCLDAEGPALVIMSDPNIWLYSPAVKYEAEECDHSEEFGKCKTELQLDTTSYICFVPRCSSKIHVKCDSFIRGKPDLKKQMCPSCRDIDPKTGKKRPKAPSGLGRCRLRKAN